MQHCTIWLRPNLTWSPRVLSQPALRYPLNTTLGAAKKYKPHLHTSCKLKVLFFVVLSLSLSLMASHAQRIALLLLAHLLLLSFSIEGRKLLKEEESKVQRLEVGRGHAPPRFSSDNEGRHVFVRVSGFAMGGGEGRMLQSVPSPGVGH